MQHIDGRVLYIDTTCDGVTPKRIMGRFSNYEAALAAFLSPEYQKASAAMFPMTEADASTYIKLDRLTIFDTLEDFQSCNR